ncbi:universal stress protein [Streptomyces sp. XD-27]|uniref:universal stress protein n=1 Tax=Streptomyces sp. XD-27 TaxID=3062779 RepID=UPI0026F43F1F|nr:universal stress protein [Streptomyces sp. XD-27]WKX73941.1 universal stress protein [Streptomyces sp. XD-27]
MTGTIAVGLDGTDPSLAAADWAAAEASARGAALRLVHAWAWHPLDTPTDADTQGRRDWAREVLRTAEDRVRRGHPELSVSAEARSDEPVPALLAAAADADLLVLGSRGHGALAGFLLGSVSLQVLRQATGPVVVVRGGYEPGPGGPGEVVTGVRETGEEGAPVLEFAFTAAAARGAPLRAVRAWHLPGPFELGTQALRAADDAGGPEPLNRRLLADALRPWRERHPDVPVTEHVEIGGAPEVLLTASGRADLVVVGRRTSGRKGIGSVTHAVLHHAPCPVAVVPYP